VPPDPPSVLLRKARDDERLALLAIREPLITDEQIGFLAQQAIEKALKAVLSRLGVSYRRTHDLSELLDFLAAARAPIPTELERCVELTPFAAEMRYDYLPPEAAPGEGFDRAGAMRLVRTALTWADQILAPRDAGP